MLGLVFLSDSRIHEIGRVDYEPKVSISGAFAKKSTPELISCNKNMFHKLQQFWTTETKKYILKNKQKIDK